MKKKMIAIGCIMLFLLTALPITQAEESIGQPRVNKMSLAHVTIRGSGTEYMIASSFILGFGNCGFMRVNLDDGHVEINKLFDASNVITLDGSHVVNIFGFVGYFRHADELICNGVALYIIWN